MTQPNAALMRTTDDRLIAGVCGGIAQIVMTESYRHADVSTIAPFEYSSMILGIVIGYFAFGDVPTAYTIVGGLIVVGAGLFIIWREQRLGLKRGRPLDVGPDAAGEVRAWRS